MPESSVSTEVHEDAFAVITMMARSATEDEKRTALKRLVSRSLVYTEASQLEALIDATLLLCKQTRESGAGIAALTRKLWRLCYAQRAGGETAVRSALMGMD